MDARAAITERARRANASYIDVDAAANALNVALAHYTSLQVVKARAEVVGLGDFLCHLFRNTVRYGKRGRRKVFYLFNGATYDRVTIERVESAARRDLAEISLALGTTASAASALGATASAASALIRHDRLVKKAIKQLRAMILEQDPDETARLMDRGAYIGLNNGVFDIRNHRFLERGSVPPSIMVSMRTRFDFQRPESLASSLQEEILEFYRKLFADPASMLLFVGSLMLRGKRKRPCVFLGTERGFNGKAKFTSLILETLGDYATSVQFATWLGNGLTGLVCASNECPRRFGDYGALQAIFHTNLEHMVPKGPSAPLVLRFGSTFVDGIHNEDQRVFQRVMYDHETMKRWAPVHFSMMIEAMRDFRTRRRKKREASVMLYAIRVVLILQARASRASRAMAAEENERRGGPLGPLALGLMRMPHVILMAMLRREGREVTEGLSAFDYPEELDFECEIDD